VTAFLISPLILPPVSVEQAPPHIFPAFHKFSILTKLLAFAFCFGTVIGYACSLVRSDFKIDDARALD